MVARVAGELLQGRDVLGEAAAAEADARRAGTTGRCAGRGPCRGRPRATSAPTSSQTFAISLMKLILVARKALDAYLTISARRDVGAHDRGAERR